MAIPPAGAGGPQWSPIDPSKAELRKEIQALLNEIDAAFSQYERGGEIPTGKLRQFLNAHISQLEKLAEKAADEFGVNSPVAKDLKKAISAWTNLSMAPGETQSFQSLVSVCIAIANARMAT